MYRCLLILLVCGNVLGAVAQKQRSIGTWRSYFSYYNAHQVEDAGSKIYVAADFSILYVDKDDNSIHSIDKSSGLSDIGVRKIKYNNTIKTLLIAYQNSNIDLLQDDGSLYNIPDIKLSSTTSSKSINDVFMKGQFAYLATDLGVALLDLQRREIRETYIIGAGGNNVVVNGVAATSGSVFAATAEGVKSASLLNGNLQDFNQWTLHTSGIPAANIQFIASLGDVVFAGVSDSSILRYDGTQWNPVFARNGWVLQNLKAENGNLYAFFGDVNDLQHFVLTLNDTGVVAETQFNGSANPIDIAIDEKIWIADKVAGLLRYNDTLSTPEKYTLNSPASFHVFDMTTSDNVMYLAAGGTNLGYNSPQYNPDGAQFWKDQWWWRFIPYNEAQHSICLDYLSVAVNRLTNKVYYASYQSGLTEIDLGQMTAKVYNQNNSPLEIVSSVNWLEVPAVCVDDNGNTWVMNLTSTTPKLRCLKVDGTWKSFNLPSSVEITRKMIAIGNKIWLCNKGVGNLDNIVVYDPGYDIDDETDDRYSIIGTGVGSGNLPVSTVWSIAEDKDGYVWVGTDVGIATFYCPSSLPQQMCDADWIKVNQGGFIGYLFSTESVRAIAVDGANRKWVGTTNGVWLISADGKETLLRFTKDNSALPSNTIQSIAINQQNGEVFIGTDQGLVSYQGDATLGEEDKHGKVLVYPNPVRADYTGVIAVRGLVDDAYIKITDAAGNLVFQANANGGTAVWDGKGYKGERVKSGVYFVYSDTDQGKGKAVAKIVLLN